MKLGKYSIPEIRKFIVAAAGLAGLLLTSFLEEFVGVIPESWSGPVTWLIGAAVSYTHTRTNETGRNLRRRHQSKKKK